MFIFFKTIHGLIQMYISGIDWRVPYVRHRRHVLLRYLLQNVLVLLARFIKVIIKRICNSEDVDIFNQNTNAFRKNVMKIYYDDMNMNIETVTRISIHFINVYAYQPYSCIRVTYTYLSFFYAVLTFFPK